MQTIAEPFALNQSHSATAQRHFTASALKNICPSAIQLKAVNKWQRKRQTGSHSWKLISSMVVGELLCCLSEPERRDWHCCNHSFTVAITVDAHTTKVHKPLSPSSHPPNTPQSFSFTYTPPARSSNQQREADWSLVSTLLQASFPH